MLSMGQNSDYDLAGCFWLKVSQDCHQGVSSVVSTGGRSAAKLTHMIVGRIQFLLGSWTWMDIGLRPPSVPCHVGLSLG